MHSFQCCNRRRQLRLQWSDRWAWENYCCSLSSTTSQFNSKVHTVPHRRPRTRTPSGRGEFVLPSAGRGLGLHPPSIEEFLQFVRITRGFQTVFRRTLLFRRLLSAFRQAHLLYNQMGENHSDKFKFNFLFSTPSLCLPGAQFLNVNYQ